MNLHRAPVALREPSSLRFTRGAFGRQTRHVLSNAGRPNVRVAIIHQRPQLSGAVQHGSGFLFVTVTARLRIRNHLLRF